MSHHYLVKIGTVGCGNISAVCFRNGARFKNIEFVACADLNLERAKAKATEFDIPRVFTADRMLSEIVVEIIVNLTIPKAHAEVALAAPESGKHVYSEKPLSVNCDQGKEIIETASKLGLRVGKAPDTFFGAADQTCRKLIDDGEIGEPVAATIGGVRRVSGSDRASFIERTATSQPKSGEVINVETPTPIAGLIDFANGAIGTLVTSFNAWEGLSLELTSAVGRPAPLPIGLPEVEIDCAFNKRNYADSAGKAAAFDGGG